MVSQDSKAKFVWSLLVGIIRSKLWIVRLEQGGAPEQVFPVGKLGCDLGRSLEGIVEIVSITGQIHMYWTLEFLILEGFDRGCDAEEEILLKLQQEGGRHVRLNPGLWSTCIGCGPRTLGRSGGSGDPGLGRGHGDIG